MTPSSASATTTTREKRRGPFVFTVSATHVPGSDLIMGRRERHKENKKMRELHRNSEREEEENSPIGSFDGSNAAYSLSCLGAAWQRGINFEPIEEE